MKNITEKLKARQQNKHSMREFASFRLQTHWNHFFQDIKTLITNCHIVYRYAVTGISMQTFV